MLKLSVFILCVCGFIGLSPQSYAEQSSYPETLPDDPRKIRTATSPEWLEAIGRFVSKTSDTTMEQCSLNLIADQPGKDGIIAVTAGHCIDHWASYEGGFLIEQNEVVFKSNSGKLIQREIVAILKSEMNPGDYAIVKLNAPIKNVDIKPLLNAPYDYFDLLDEDMFGEKFKPYATMAGFSADKGLGGKGKVMTYDERCRLYGGASGRKQGFCYSYQGASGGAVAVTVALGDMADETWQVSVQSYFVGSIVGARGGDDNSKTLFTETTHYTRILDHILASH